MNLGNQLLNCINRGSRAFSGIATVFFLVLPNVHAALLGTYDFQGGTTGVAAGANANVQWGTFQLTGVTAYSEPDLFAATGWSKNSVNDLTKYVSFTVQAAPNYYLKLTDITFYCLRQPTGPQVGTAEVIVGGVSTFMNTTYAPSASLIQFNFADINFTKSQVEFRFYGWKTPQTSGAMAFNDVSVNGEVSTVPEPVNLALAISGMVALGTGAWHRFRKEPDARQA